MKKNIVIKIISLILSVCAAATLIAACGDIAPDGGTTPETTPLVTPSDTPHGTVPEATSGEATDGTPPETVPGVEYNIFYDLDGGIDGGNPDSHNSGEPLDLIAPIRPGYDFIGWTGSGVDTPTVDMTVQVGNREDLSFKANWSQNTYTPGKIKLDETHFGKDDGLTAPDGETPIAEYYDTGTRGEGIYLLKTVYTSIDIDGEPDPAYSYGIHIKSGIYYSGSLYGSRKKTTFDLYLIRTQDGNICGYMDVTDPDVEVNESLFNLYAHHCDSIDFYYDVDNGGSGNKMFSFVADPTGKYVRGTPPTHKVKLTEKGYAVEFTFDKDGEPFLDNDELGFGVYINDCFGYVSNSSYNKTIVKHPSKLNPVADGFKFPGDGTHDALRMSLESASGKVDISTEKSELSGNIIEDIFENRASVALVYDENATAQTILNARALHDMLIRSGVNSAVISDDHISDNYDFKILFGMTEREESVSLIESLGYNGYGVSVTGDTVAVVGWNEEAAAKAYAILYELFDQGALGNGATHLGSYVGKVELTGADKLPVLDSFDSITDVGEGAYSVYKLESTADEFESYTEKLSEAGYTLYTSRSVESVLFATYYDDETVVSVQYGGEGDRSLRIVAEPASNTALPSLDKPAAVEAVCTPSIIMLDCHTTGCMCIIIQLSNGHFIIADSGHNGHQAEIYNHLRQRTPDRKPVVEAWILTHFHQDHIGAFIDYTGIGSCMRQTTVKSVIYNFPSEQVLSTAAHSPTDMNNLELFFTKRRPDMTDKGTVFYRARTGQKYYFGDAEVEILWTYEDIMPFNVFTDRTNPTCIGFSVSVAGQKIMFTGDSSGEEFTMAYKKYGQYLKSDFVQLSHHGQGDGYSPIEFYRAVGAPYVINPGIGDYYGVGEAWARDNAKKYFMRGALGVCTIPLPYDGGSFESSRGQ